MTWIRRHRLRAAVYGCLLVACLAAGIAAALFLTGGDRGALAWIASRGPVRGWFTERGVRYEFESLRIGGLRGPCPLEVRARNARFEMAGPPDVRGSAGSVSGCIATAFELADLRSGVAGFEVAVARAQAAPLPGRYSASGVSIADAAGPIFSQRGVEAVLPREIVLDGGLLRSPGSPETEIATIDRTRISGLEWPAAPGQPLRLRAVDVETVRSALDETAWSEKRVRSWQAALAQIAGLPHSALGRAVRAVADAQRILGWAAIAAIAFFFVLKFLVSNVARRWWPRLTLAVAAVTVPVALYFALRSFVGPLALEAIAFAVAAAAAVLLYFLVYRRGPEWHARWEPAAVDALAAPVIVLLLIGWGYPVRLPAFSWPRTVQVDEINVADAAVQVRASQCGPAEIARVDAHSAKIAGLRLALDPDTLALRRATAQIAARGETRSPWLEKQAGLAAPARTAFCAAVEVGAAASQAPGVPECDAPGDSVALAAALALDLERFTLAYDARTLAWVQGVAVDASLGGDGQAARLHSLRTVGDSPIQIASAAGQFRLAPPIGSSLELQGIAGNGISTRTLKLRGSLAGRCTSPSWNVAVDAGGLRVSGPDGWSVAAARSSVAVSSRNSALRAETRLEDLALESPWLKAALPRLHSAVDARAAGGLVPRTLEGAGSFELFGPGGGVLLSFAPVRFQADIERGDFRLPRQPWSVKQSLAPELPATFEGHVTVAALSLRTAPAFDYTVEAGIPEIRMAPFDLPRAAALRRIGALDLQTKGTLRGLELGRLPLQGSFQWPAIPDPPALSVAARIVNGAAEASVSTRDGRGIAVGDIHLRPERIVFEGGALHEAAAGAEIGRLRTADGGGRLALRSDFRWTPGGFTANGSLLDETGRPLLAMGAVFAPGELRLASSEPFGLARLYPAALPYLRHFGWTPGEFEPLAAVDSLDVRLRLNGNAVSSADAQVNLGPGLLLRFASPTAFLRSGDLTLDRRAAFGLDYRAASPAEGEAGLTADVEGLQIRVQDENGAEHEIAASLRVEAAADLLPSPRAQSALARVAGEALRDASGHIEQASRAFGQPSPGGLRMNWDARVRNAGGNALTLGHDRIDARLATEIRDLRLGGWSLAGTAGLRAGTSLFREHLMIDAHAPAAIDLVAPGGTRTRIRFEQPFALAFFPELRPSPSPRMLLFDTDHYARLFREFPKVYARDSAAEILPPRALALGALELEESSFSMAPLFAAIGHRGALQFCPSPFAGRLSYGETRGEAHAELRWRPREALLDFVLRSEFAGVEAGGIRIGLGPAPNALLDHRLDGSLFVRTSALPVSLKALSAFAVRPEDSPLLRGVLVNLHASSSKDPANIGVLQAGAQTQLPMLNEVLRRVSPDLRLEARTERLLFREMAFELDLADGQVSLERPLLRLSGLQLATGGIHSDSEIRVHLGRPNPALKPYTAAELLGFLRRLFANAAAASPLPPLTAGVP